LAVLNPAPIVRRLFALAAADTVLQLIDGPSISARASLPGARALDR
jgi:hypothetical protein